MSNKLEIRPLVGFGELKFGADQSEVENYLGEPQEIEDLPGEADESDAEVWNYWDDGHTVFFEKDMENKCTCFETDNDDAILFGKNVFDLDEKQIIELMETNDYREIDTEDEEWGERRVSYSDAVMDFYFEDGKLISVSWGVMIDLDNDQPEWPK
ncbi:MAG: hypothetical protein ABR597_08085 [Bacteroidales bacterium]